MQPTLLLAFAAGIGILLLLILVFRLNAFIALLISSITVGILAGMPLPDILTTIINGMGGTLGYVAIIIGLGAIFGGVLEYTGATQILSQFLLDRFGTEKAPIALSLAGFFIAIPVFFDVAFIILVPVLYALQRQSGKSLLFYAIPLLSSLAVTHAFIPPTPGPIAVAEIIGADLGWIILFGFIVGLPTTWLAGIVFGKYISKKIFAKIVTDNTLIADKHTESKIRPPVGIIFGLILFPLLLIVTNTVLTAIFPTAEGATVPTWLSILQFLGHPIIALIFSTLLAIYGLGNYCGVSRNKLQEVSIKALQPAGIIILITGAGGVFKQMLVETGAGEMLAQQFLHFNIMPLLAAFAIALLVRLLQGSATVAMITAASIIEPVLSVLILSPQLLALTVLSIAAGASGFSHLNDSGFWLVSRYLGLSEQETLQSWTVMTGILALVALSILLILWMFLK